MGIFGNKKLRGYIFALDYCPKSGGQWVRGHFEVPIKDAKDGRSPSDAYWIARMAKAHNVHPSQVTVCRVVNYEHMVGQDGLPM